MSHDPPQCPRPAALVIRLEVGPDDYGRVIGRNGRIAQAMRGLLKVSAVRHREYASLEIGD